MRLSLLARKLTVKPSVIINELLVEGEKPLHGNSKLTAAQIDAIIELFGPLPEETTDPEPIEAPVEEEVEREMTSTAAPTAESPAEAEPEITVTDEANEAEIESEVSLEAPAIFAAEAVPDAPTETSAEEVTESATAEAPLGAQDTIAGLSDETSETAVTIEPIENGYSEGISEVQTESYAKTGKREVLVSDLLEDPDEELLENTDVLIKAPKVHLPGLTVKGKIDLPEPKPKPEKEETDKEEEAEEDYRGRRGRHRGKRRKYTNPVAAARMREERKAERQKKAQQQQDKERKRKHYQQNIQSKAAPPPKKKVNKKSAPVATVHSNTAQKKNLNALQRFWKWMNT